MTKKVLGMRWSRPEQGGSSDKKRGAGHNFRKEETGTDVLILHTVKLRLKEADLFGVMQLPSSRGKLCPQP